jgi:hypothetical protein
MMETYVYLNPDDLYVGYSTGRRDENPSLVDKVEIFNRVLETMAGMQACLEEMGDSEGRTISVKRAGKCRVHGQRGARAIEMLRRSAEL